jgi:hypothetical protein
MGDDEQQDKNKNDVLLGFLTLENRRLESHGEKIWEEMKHFSWALYLLLAAPFFLKQWENSELKYYPWLLIFPSLAIIVAFIATLSICKESKDFLDALGTVLSIEKRLGFHKENANEIPKMLVSKQRMEMLKTDESINDFIKRKQSIFCKLGSISTRNLFVLYFIFLLIFGIVEIIIFVFYLK